ncbi:MAG: NAD-glutamate dehydrogenase [Nocardioides sp.]|uniref:NAD-glutamate dehydrogenase n=1 Tax=Nocardioides sp. TaxID=35761 RepID=UPI0039E5F32C
MSTTTTGTMASPRTELIRAVIRTALEQAPPDKRQRLEKLFRGYLRQVAVEDLEARSALDVYGALASQLDLAAIRPQGTAAVRVLTPTADAEGWSAGGRSVVEVVVDDMPYLVDSVTMELARRHHDVHLVIHPVFDVSRDVTGVLGDVNPVRDATVPPPAGAERESWMHLEIDLVGAEEAADIVGGLQGVLQDVREAVEDEPKLRRRMAELVAELRRTPPVGVDPEESAETAALLEWLADDHFTFLGYRDYRLEGTPESPEFLRGISGSGLGILRADPDLSPDRGRMPRRVQALAREPQLLVLAKANSRATVSRSTYLDHVGIKEFDPTGTVVGEHRFLGLFTTKAARESVTRIPVLRHKVAAVLEAGGVDPNSHTGKALLEILETYPREELFHATSAELATMAEVALGARERRTLRVIVRPDTYGRYVSVLVNLPRDRYNTTLRERFAQILTEHLHATDIEFTVRISDSSSARVHFLVHVPAGELDSLDLGAIEARLQAASRSWRDDLASALIAEHGETAAHGLAHLLDAFPEAYKEDFTAADGATDLGRLARLLDRTSDRDGGPAGIDFAMYAEPGAPADEARLKVYRVGEPISLSRLLPILTSLGVEVRDERPYELDGSDEEEGTFVYDLGLRHRGAGLTGSHPAEWLTPAQAQEHFVAALAALWSGDGEVDGFNALVLAAGLTHRQVMVLRAYAKYLRQGGTLFSQATIEAALLDNVEITRGLIGLFEERFAPRAIDAEERAEREAQVVARLESQLDAVRSLDHDRILRSYLVHLRATLRTNYWQRSQAGPGAGRPKSYLSLKLEPTLIPDLPQPRPAYEIFVYSPRVEGVHLRFGPVARGGLRWSDRRDDFRTEVLGLVKAQMVKNAVIVPVGAKGGFVPKQLPDPQVDRDAWLAEGKAAYRTFICGLLDLTDNLVDGECVPPPEVVRHDTEPDSYLVVAADKGTATFSDLANSIAAEYGFWLGDAFASGGSAGYDHKAMGITARGAWVSVRRHFRELGLDTQREDFTVVGVGDMSGDVFGNGMLLSEHIRLIAAFDHRDIFLDPDPDPAASYAERRRLFDLPRSSWQEYDSSLISAGGGVWSRQLKSVPIGPQVRVALGLDEGVTRLTPAELIGAILRAPADLFWNGGIGTYVKASGESHAAAGDKANDAVRVDGRDLRVRVVGEGGNLGLTQAGRVEFAISGGPDGTGGRINTDAIDNAAGVDTSDHEVNLKILLDRQVAAGDLSTGERDDVLGQMTDEVAELVLHDNEEQNLALANAAAHAHTLLHVHEEWMADLAARDVLDREVEGLPSSAEVARRLKAGGALTSPEHAVLMSWTKIELARELLASTLPDEAYVATRLERYFPTLVRKRFATALAAHPLRREIVVTQVVGDLVNQAGKTFWPRLSVETGASLSDLTRSLFVAREVLEADELHAEILALDHQVDAGVQTRMRVDIRTAAERATRRLVELAPTTGEELVARFAEPVRGVLRRFPDLLAGSELTAYQARRTRLTGEGVPEELATRVAMLPAAYVLFGIVDVARDEGQDPIAVTRQYTEVGERLGLDTVLARIVSLPREDTWETMARTALRDDLHAVHLRLTVTALHDPSWLDSAPVLAAAATLGRIVSEERADLARLSVGLRVIRGLLPAS